MALQSYNFAHVSMGEALEYVLQKSPHRMCSHCMVQSVLLSFGLAVPYTFNLGVQNFRSNKAKLYLILHPHHWDQRLHVGTLQELPQW